MIMNRVDGQILQRHDTTRGRQCSLSPRRRTCEEDVGERKEEREQERWSEKRYVCTKSDASAKDAIDVEVGDNDNDQVCPS
jgi:hypothetical protein